VRIPQAPLDAAARELRARAEDAYRNGGDFVGTEPFQLGTAGRITDLAKSVSLDRSPMAAARWIAVLPCVMDTVGFFPNVGQDGILRRVGNPPASHFALHSLAMADCQSAARMPSRPA
jgi:hypothetical protein